VLQIFLCRLPGVVAMTLPMGAMFGSLMCMSNLSSHGEVGAMRAGGISFPRMCLPVLIVGVLTSVTALSFNELVVPYGNDAAYRLLAEHAKAAQPREHFIFQIPAHGPPQRVVYAGRFDPRAKQLDDLIIYEFRAGRPWKLVTAERAEWRGEEWFGHGVKHTTIDSDGNRTELAFDSFEVKVGKDPGELERRDKRIDDMSMAELKALLAQRRRMGLPYKPAILEIEQLIHMRLAVPWAALGFALVGLPLGLRPTRATAGIGLGLSVVIIFAYYVLLHTLDIVGEQGGMPPIVTAWLPNAALFAAGIGLFLGVTR